MRIMDAKAAAEEIHGVVEGRLHPTAEDRHIESFVTEVCNDLGLEPSAVNIALVADALREADIQPHQIQAYPKMAVDENGKAILLDPMGKRLPVDVRGFSTVEGVPGHHVIFENEEEEKAFGTPKEGDVVETVRAPSAALVDTAKTAPGKAELERKTAADKGAAEVADARYAADVKAKQDAEDLARKNQPRVPA